MAGISRGERFPCSLGLCWPGHGSSVPGSVPNLCRAQAPPWEYVDKMGPGQGDEEGKGCRGKGCAMLTWSRSSKQRGPWSCWFLPTPAVPLSTMLPPAPCREMPSHPRRAEVAPFIPLMAFQRLNSSAGFGQESGRRLSALLSVCGRAAAGAPAPPGARLGWEEGDSA